MKMDRRGLIGGGAAMVAAALPLRAWADEKVFINSIAVDEGRVWIAAKIGDKGPFFFIVDTGSYISMIENDFAKSMGFHVVDNRRSMGIGGVSEFNWYNAGTVTLASGIRFPDMLFSGMRSRPSKDAVGLFGAGLFTTFDSDLDFAKGEWRAYPGGRPNFNGLTKLKSRFTDWQGGQRIVANAMLDGYDGDFLLDTGAPGEVLLHGRAATKSGLWNGPSLMRRWPSPGSARPGCIRGWYARRSSASGRSRSKTPWFASASRGRRAAGGTASSDCKSSSACT